MKLLNPYIGLIAANQNEIQPEWILSKLHAMQKLNQCAISELNKLAISLKQLANICSVTLQKLDDTQEFCDRCQNLLVNLDTSNPDDLEILIRERDKLQIELQRE